jgi:hypothetical protein
MKAGNLQVYFDARDASDNEIASNGQVDSPSIIEIRKKGTGKHGGDDEDDPTESHSQPAAGRCLRGRPTPPSRGRVLVWIRCRRWMGLLAGGNLEWERT